MFSSYYYRDMVNSFVAVAVAAAAARIVQRVDYWFEGRPDEQGIRIEFVDFEAEWVIGAVLLIAVEIEKLANSPSGLKLFEDIVVPYNYELEKMMDQFELIEVAADMQVYKPMDLAVDLKGVAYKNKPLNLNTSLMESL